MPSCFIIQPFDGGPFDRRFDEILGPAIQAAGLDPYRVDRDASASVLITSIEDGIRHAEICLADISLDNPNVWFELGFATAAGKVVVLICNSSRSKFPFDVQHRNVITYATESKSDLESLAARITARLKAALTRQAKLGVLARIDSPLAENQGLKPYEQAALVSIAEGLVGPDDSVSAYSVRQSMDQAGFKRIATSLALASLLKSALIESFEVTEYHEPYTAYRPSATGWDWLRANEHLLSLRDEDPF